MVEVSSVRELMEKQFAEPSNEGYAYVMLSPASGLYKIGRSKDPWGRRDTLSREVGVELVLVDYWLCDDYVVVEQALHSRFAGSRVHGEWFRLSDPDIPTIGELVMVLDSGRNPIREGGWENEHPWHCDCGEC